MKTEKKWLYGFILAALVIIAFTNPGSAFAQDNTPTDNDVNAIARQMFCPVCENTPLDVCPTEACKDWRELIRLKLTEGWTEQQIKTYFVEQYGARVLAEPPMQGLNLLMYILPPALMLAGAAFLGKAFLSMRQNAERSKISIENDKAAESAEDKYANLIEDEINKREA